MVGIRITGIDIFILKTFYIIGNDKAVQRYSISFTGNVFHISISCTVPESVTCLSIPEGFLAIDGILDLCLNVVDGLVVYPKVIEKRLMSELPFMATENIMMDAVKAGGNRQELHEKIRTLSMEAGRNVKERGLENNLLELIAADDEFPMTLEELQKTMDPSKYVGRAPSQVVEFMNDVIQPILDENKELLGVKAEINV